jgi:NTP pyrophosphatase (non-canonical NTP hydrolase)
MQFSEYSAEARKSDVYPKVDTVLGRLPVYPMLAALGELGEAAEKVKKAWRDHTILGLDGFLRELGDVLWYLDAAAKDVGSDLETVAQLNIDKLTDRRARGVLAGTGDYR